MLTYEMMNGAQCFRKGLITGFLGMQKFEKIVKELLKKCIVPFIGTNVNAIIRYFFIDL